MIRRGHIAIYIFAVIWLTGAYLLGYFVGLDINGGSFSGALGGLAMVGVFSLISLGALALAGLVIGLVEWAVEDD